MSNTVTWRRGSLAAALAVMLCAGVIAAHGARSGGAVAFPGPAPAPCGAELLQATVSWQGAAGSRIADMTAVNTGTEACTLSGRPNVSLLDGDAVLAVAQTDGPDPDRGGLTGTGGIVLHPGQGAAVGARWSNYCGPTSGQPITIRLTLADAGGAVTAAPADERVLAAPPPCNGPAPSTVEVTPFYLNDPASRAVREYMAAVTNRDYQAAYDLLGADLQATQPFDAFVVGYADTEEAAAAVLESVMTTEGQGIVRVRLAGRHTDGTVVRYAGWYALSPIDGVLRIVAASIAPV